MAAEGFFSVISVHRADLEDSGFDASKLSDSQMRKVASMMGEFYSERGDFWLDLKLAAERLGVTRLEERVGLESEPDEWPKQKVI